MRLKQNITLIFLITCLISFIIGVDALDILSFPTTKTSLPGKEIKVIKPQLPIQQQDNVEIIWDVSGSMWAKVDNSNKLSISRKVIKTIVNQLPHKVKLGIRVFGSKIDKNNQSVLAIPLGRNNHKELLGLVNQVIPAGKSPIGLNLLQAKEDLISLEGTKHIILVTDGRDTGKIMPSQVINKLSRNQIKTHIIHVGRIDKIEQLKLKSLARLGHGRYFTYFESQEVIPTINLD
ncbi:hypothetical protein JCM16358_02910 [Halanaerocella petrolearia]